MQLPSLKCNCKYKGHSQISMFHMEFFKSQTHINNLALFHCQYDLEKPLIIIQTSRKKLNCLKYSSERGMLFSFYSQPSPPASFSFWLTVFLLFSDCPPPPHLVKHYTTILAPLLGHVYTIELSQPLLLLQGSANSVKGWESCKEYQVFHKSLDFHIGMERHTVAGLQSFDVQIGSVFLDNKKLWYIHVS